ncbi:hypothetical protein ABIA96_002624 [Bradyrhizobium sp. LB11.1]
MVALHIPLSSPGWTGRSSTPRLHDSSRAAAEYWIPASRAQLRTRAGMTPSLKETPQTW